MFFILNLLSLISSIERLIALGPELGELAVYLRAPSELDRVHAGEVADLVD
jgi:hypothetical protein